MNQYADLGLKDEEWIMQKVRDESDFQIQKWSIQTHSAFEWLTYTIEELGELADAVSEHESRGGTKEHVVREAIQVATLALKIAEMYKKETSITEDEIELLPCPLCGGVAHLVRIPEKRLVSVFCENPSCGAEVSRFMNTHTNDKIQKTVINSLIRTWNKRSC